MDDLQEALVDNFAAVTSCGRERAIFYLQSAGWDLQAALGSFYDTERVEPEPASEEGRGKMEVSPQQPLIPPTTSSSKGGFATLSDYQPTQDRGKEEEDDSEKFYAGGSEHSGQLIEGPPRKKPTAQKLAQEVFDAAKKQGAVNVEEEEKLRQQEKAEAFRGTGFKLGDSEGPSLEIGGVAANKKREKGHRYAFLFKANITKQNDYIVMVDFTIWTGIKDPQSVVDDNLLSDDGFSVDDGPLRNGQSEEDRKFLAAVSRGEIPEELLHAAQGGEVDIDLQDKRNEPYSKPKPKLVAFSGEGHKLGSLAPVVVTHEPPEAASKEPPIPEVPLDPSQPTTTVQIRLADGTRLVAKFNPSHTVNDIRNFINLSRPSMSATTYVLMTTFPNRELMDLGQSLADAKLLNAVIMQRMK